MNNFNLFTPTKVVFGKDTESQTGALVKAFGGQKVLLHYGSGSVVRSGLLDKIKASLQAEGIAFTELGGAVPNPRLAWCDRSHPPRRPHSGPGPCPQCAG